MYYHRCIMEIFKAERVKYKYIVFKLDKIIQEKFKLNLNLKVNLVFFFL